MRKATEASLDEWLKELDSRTAPGGEGMTTAEIAEALHISDQAVKDKILRPALREGRLIRTRKVVESISGRMTPVPAYKIAKAKK
jgi:hypothetical protein